MPFKFKRIAAAILSFIITFTSFGVLDQVPVYAKADAVRVLSATDPDDIYQILKRQNCPDESNITYTSNFRKGYSPTIDEINEANTTVVNILKEASKKETDYDRLKYIYDWIRDNNAYNNAGAANHSDLNWISSFVSGISPVCMGYARGFKFLCDQLGIECIYESASDHSWDCVKLNGKWYAVDVTWGDGLHPDDYFLVGSKSPVHYITYENASYTFGYDGGHHPWVTTDKMEVIDENTSRYIKEDLSETAYDPSVPSYTTMPPINPYPFRYSFDDAFGKYPYYVRTGDFETKDGVDIWSNTLYLGETGRIKNGVAIGGLTTSENTAVNKKVEFTSLTPDIASVDQDGVVTGKKIGRARILVEPEDKTFYTPYNKWMGENTHGYTYTYQKIIEIDVKERVAPFSWSPDSTQTEIPQPEITLPVSTPERERKIVSDIDLSSTDVSVNENNTADVSVQSKKKITVKSNNSKIAAAKYNKNTGIITITGKSAGYTSIRVRAGGETKKINVTVTAEPFELSQSAVSLNYKQKATVTTAKKKNLKISSSDKKIATAKYNKKKGTITIEGKAKGSAVITVRNGNITKTIDVDVDATTTKLSLSKKTLKLTSGGKSTFIVIKATPKKNITGEIPEVTCNNPDVVFAEYVATSNKIKVTPLQPGTATVTVKVGKQIQTLEVSAS